MTQGVWSNGSPFTQIDRFLQYIISHKFVPLLKIQSLRSLMFGLHFKFLYCITHVLGTTKGGNETWWSAAHPSLIISNYWGMWQKIQIKTLIYINTDNYRKYW